MLSETSSRCQQACCVECVLILVVMEYALGADFDDEIRFRRTVLILVVMEYALGAFGSAFTLIVLLVS